MLASASKTRRALLTQAGLTFEAMSSAIDEAAVKRQAQASGASAADTAWRLARLKAAAVGRPEALVPEALVPEAVVIGCDQILVCDGTWFDKPATVTEARNHLRRLRGRQHVLETATSVQRGGVEIWRHLSSPTLTMRPFSDAFLEAYLACEGECLFGSVGAYRLEGPGIQLFDRVDGDHSAILGLPLLPLLGFLRGIGAIGG